MTDPMIHSHPLTLFTSFSPWPTVTDRAPHGLAAAPSRILLLPPRIDQRGGDLSREILPTGLGPPVLPPQLSDPKPPGDSDPYLDSLPFAADAGGDVI
jgi:hypothetical protein